MAKKKRDKNRVLIFDTTARDGKQSPGCNFGPDDTIRLAHQLARMKVDVMEAGFPVSSDDDFEAVRRVAHEVPGITCAALARANKDDIDCVMKAFGDAIKRSRIHIFIATSDVHMEKKLNKSPDEVIRMAVEAIKYAQACGIDNIEFSPEDASRTGFSFLPKIVAAAAWAGARTINIPDTVGYAVGTEYPNMILRLMHEVSIIERNDIVLSLHCHNDCGLATANTLAGLAAGARQAHCTINGIGERAGNTHLAEVVMALKTRRDYYKLDTGINTKEIGPTARLVSSIIGKPIHDTLPIVGANVHPHSAGIHQDGVLKERATYEIMSPEDTGWQEESLPLSSQSGRHGFKQRLAYIGYEVNAKTFGVVYAKFKELAAMKPLVHNTDLHMLMQETEAEQHAEEEGWIRLLNVDYHKLDGTRRVFVGLTANDNTFEASGTGNGPFDATWSAVRSALTRQKFWPGEIKLESFDVSKGQGGIESVGIARVKISLGDYAAFGRGSDTDIVVACTKAHIAALNNLINAPILRERIS